MIINLPATSDTFVTNLNVKNANGKNANFGKSSTLDLFKLYNENKYSYSRAFLVFDLNLNIVDQSTISITDTDNITATLLFDVSIVANNDFNFDDQKNAYIIGINNTTSDQYTQRLTDAINYLNEEGIIKITALNNTSEVILQQTVAGEAGDKNFVLSDNLALSVTSKTGVNSFSRIDFSCILIKFNTESILSDFAPNGNSGAFESVNAKLVLKDVSTGVQKPKDYKVVCYRLNKEFFEGIGKDVVSFSDRDIANFISLTNDESWAVQEYLTKSSLAESDVFETELSNISIIKGDENIEFDISDYINSIISRDIAEDKGFLITLHDDMIYNNKSYFAKRLGSRHLLKKSLRPQIILSINDSEFEHDINKKEYNVFDSKHDFYFTNNTLDSFKDITFPTGYDQVTMKLVYKEDVIIDKTNSSALSDYKGNVITGIRKVTVEQADNPFNTKELIDLSRLNNNYLNFTLTWYFSDSTEALEDITIKSYDIKVNYFVSDVIEKQRLYITSKFDIDLTANNSIYHMSTMVIDLNYRHPAVKLPLKLKTNNIGDLFYQIVDYHTKEILIPYDTENNATKMFLNDDFYTANVYVPEEWANRTISFEYVYFDSKNNKRLLKPDTQNTFKVK